MALSYLCDTSVVTRLGTPAVRARLAALLEQGPVGRSSLTDLEVGFSARTTEEWDGLTQALDVFSVVELGPVHVDRARTVQRLLAERGLRGRKVPDLLIAAAAELAGLTVLHYDRDFDHIAAATGQAVEWIVEPGSID